MFKTANLILFCFTFILTNSIYAQPECAVLLFPNDGAVDQELTVNLMWEPAAIGEAPTSYDVYWGQNIGSLNFLGNTTGTSQSISTPLLGTTFYWRIDAIGPGGTVTGCTEFSYTTLDIPEAPIIDCGADAPIDVTFDLESTTDWTGDIGSGNNIWRFNVGQTPSSNTGPIEGQDGAGTQYLYYESSGGSPIDAEAISPAIDLTEASGDVALTFYMHAFGGGINMLDVSVGLTPTGPFTSIWSWNGAYQSMQDEDWVQVGLNLVDYTGEIVYLNFTNVITANNSGQGDLAIDQIEIHGCESSASSNNTCALATVLATAGEPGSLSNEAILGATDSGLGTTNCSPTIPTGDVFYSIETDIDGGVLTVDLTSPPGAFMHMGLYQGTCGNLTEVDCASASAAGQDITLNYFADNAQNPDNPSARSAPETYFLRVYDTNESGEPFDLDASGSALAALPVQLINWKADLLAKSVKLRWNTAQEVNTEKFVIQKSLEGTRWSDIGTVKAVGFTSNLSSYSFDDQELYAVQYYRLKIIDFDGYVEYSGIINITRDDLGVTIYPNPATSIITIAQYNKISDNPIYEIYDVTGKLMLSRTNIKSDKLSVEELQEGMYTLIVKDANQVYTTRFTKI